MGSTGADNIPNTLYTSASNFRNDLEQYLNFKQSSHKGQYIVSDKSGTELGVVRFGKSLNYSVVKISNGTDSDGRESWTSYNNLRSALNVLRSRRK